MGLGKFIERKVKEKFSPPPEVKEARAQQSMKNKAEDLKLKQELYEERMKGRRVALKKQAYNQGVRSAQKGSGFMGTLNALESSVNSTEKSFGFSSGNLGIGLSDNFFGLPGYGNSKPKAPPTKTTKIVTGGKTITIKDTAPEQQQKKKEPHPLDIFEW